MGETTQARHRGLSHVKDARGRRVVQLDPVALQLLRRHDVIEADVLQAITSEPGIRMSKLERGLLSVSIVILFVTIGLAVGLALAGRPWAWIIRRIAPVPVLYCLVWPWLAWGELKRRRFGKIAAAMLRHRRCPHCGYDLRGLPTDPADGATVCPECGCAWRLGSHAAA